MRVGLHVAPIFVIALIAEQIIVADSHCGCRNVDVDIRIKLNKKHHKCGSEPEPMEQTSSTQTPSAAVTGTGATVIVGTGTTKKLDGLHKGKCANISVPTDDLKIGGWVLPLESDGPKIEALAKYVLKFINGNVNFTEPYYYVFKQVNCALKQVVNGWNYAIEFKAGESVCLKNQTNLADAPNCTLSGNGHTDYAAQLFQPFNGTVEIKSVEAISGVKGWFRWWWHF